MIQMATSSLYTYNFRYKGQFGYEWSYYPFKPDGQSTIPYGMFTVGLSPKLPASSSDYTVVSINVSILGVPTGTQAEFQAQTLIGHIDYIASGLLAGSYYRFTGVRSDWSDTQTLTIGESQTPMPSPETTPPTASPVSTPTPPQESQQIVQEIIIVATIAVAVFGAGLGLLIYLVKRK